MELGDASEQKEQTASDISSPGDQQSPENDSENLKFKGGQADAEGFKTDAKNATESGLGDQQMLADGVSDSAVAEEGVEKE